MELRKIKVGLFVYKFTMPAFNDWKKGKLKIIQMRFKWGETMKWININWDNKSINFHTNLSIIGYANQWLASQRLTNKWLANQLLDMLINDWQQ